MRHQLRVLALCAASSVVLALGATAEQSWQPVSLPSVPGPAASPALRPIHPLGTHPNRTAGTSDAVRSAEAQDAVPRRAARPPQPAHRAAKPAHPNTRAKAKRPVHAKRRAAPKRATHSTRPATPGHYIRSLRGGRHDIVSMRALGARDAAHNQPHQTHVVLLDIGGQTPHGVFLSTTHRFVSYATLARAMTAYTDGYHSKQKRNAPVIIAIGTNNDLLVSAGAGRLWANKVVDPVRAHAAKYAAMTIAGADDIEPGFRAGPSSTRAWLIGYLRNTSAPFLFNGSADGCSGRHWPSQCGGGWTSNDIIGLAGGIAPARTLVLPQVYNATMAMQWGQLARSAIRTRHGPLRILGALTENAACGRDPYCPTMNSRQAAALLKYRVARGGAPIPAVPVQVDLEVR